MRRARAVVAVVIFALLVLVLFILSFSIPPLFGVRLTGIEVQIHYPVGSTTAYFGPTVREICTNCPQVLDNRAIFTVSFSLVNLDTSQVHTVTSVAAVQPSLSSPAVFGQSGSVTANVTGYLTPQSLPFSISGGGTALVTIKFIAPASRGSYELIIAVTSPG